MMTKKEITICFEQYSPNDEQLSASDNALIQQAQQAALRSYSPYSRFQVGAAVRLSNGQIIQGCNQENAAYPSSLCAERVALYYANALYPEAEVEAIAVCAYTAGQYIAQPVPPCGACRQVMLETETRYKKPIRIILSGKNGVITIQSAADLLPLNFDQTFLMM